MPAPRLRHLRLAAAAALVVAVALPTRGGAAELVVEARVLAVTAAPGDVPARDHAVVVERVVRGTPPASALVVRVPGGVRADGVGLLVPGAPRLVPGERLRLRLAAGEDGTFVLPALGRDAVVLSRPGLSRPDDGVPGGGDGYRLATSSTEPPPLGCGVEGGHLLRWFVFDAGNAVPWFPSAPFPSAPGFPDAAAGHAALDAALAAWSDVPGAGVRLLRGETTAAADGLTAPDGLSTVVFDDPGGVLPGGWDGDGRGAVTGLWFDCATRPWTAADGSEQQVHAVLEADVVFRDGLAAELAGRPDGAALAAELLAHELGHALGLLDSADPQALMAPEPHGDGRGAVLAGDDADAVRDLYGPHGPTPPAAPSGLLAIPDVSPEPNAGQVHLRWRDRSLEESELRIDVAATSRFIELPAAIPADTEEVLLTGLPRGRELRFRVRAVNDFGSSSPSNVATVRIPEVESCVRDERTLCLLGDRYRVRARFRPPHPDAPWRRARAVSLDDGGGAFWFFHRDNLEATVRLERDPEGRVALDAGSLTTVVHELTVTDTMTGATRTLRRDDGLCGARVADLFPGTTDPSPTPPETVPAVALPWIEVAPKAARVTVAATDAPAGGDAEDLPAVCRERTALCLPETGTTGPDAGRFVVRVAGFDPVDGTAVAARGIVVAGDVAFFAFGEAADLDVAVKVLDARALGGGFWLFHAGLGERPYRVTVTDRVTGATRTLDRPAGRCGGSGTLPVATAAG